MSKQLPYPLPPEVANSIGAKGGITLRAWKNWCHRSIRQHKVHEKALIARMKEMSQALDDATAFR